LTQSTTQENTFLGAILVYLIAAYIFIKMFKTPWVAVIAYLAFGVMQPQYIWSWHFDSLPTSPSKLLAILAILSWFFAALNKKVNFTVYKNKQNIVLLTLWGLMHLSDIFSPFPIYLSAVPAKIVLGTLNSIMILYFVAIGLLVSETALKYLSILLVVVVVYYVYWSNDQYLSYNWSQFNQGRLMGPLGSIYRDENVFATVFMVGLPFLLFSFFYIKKNILKFAIIIVIPLLWHSLFLTGSRGAMLASAVSTFVASRLIKSKIFDKVIIVGFIAALLTQGGAMLNRSTDLAEQSQISSGDKPLNPRIVSWKHGLSHAINHPVLGVGVQRFQHATRVYFPESKAYVAHNTFISLLAQSGMIAGFLYLYLLWLAFKNYRFCVKNGIDKYPVLDYTNKATITALAGFSVCSIFLNLEIFEPFYYLLVMVIVKQQLFEQKLAENNKIQDKALKIKHVK